MNRWKNFIALLLTVVMIMTNSTVSHAGKEKQNNEGSSTTVSGEGSADASSNASGDVSGEGQKEYVSISFYNKKQLVKTVQIEKGGTVELWEPKPYSDIYTFKGWYYLISETHGIFVTETKTYDEDMNLYAYWEDDPNWQGHIDPINYEEMREREKIQEQTDYTRKLTYCANIEIKNITINKKGKLSLKIRSTFMPTSPIELQYSTSKKFTKGKTKTKVIKRTKNKSVKTFKKVTIKKLKKNKTYYIRARVKSQYNGETFYSKWSKVQKVKMKGKKKQTKK